MSELPNFPMLSQRDSDINADFDCVPASIAACLEYLTGRQYTAGQVKDAVLGSGYTGGTGASEFVDYCQAQGVRLVAVDGTGPELVAAICDGIDAGHPALITEPDPYLAGWTHVCAAYKYNGSTITVMDPWIDAPVSKSFADWSVSLQDNQIWRLEKAMKVPSGWQDDGQTLTAPNGHKVTQGFRDHILNDPNWSPDDQPESEEFHADPLEFSNPSLGAGQKLICTRTILEWTTTRGVFVAWAGQEVYALLQRLAAQPAPTTGQPALTDAEKASLAALRELKSALPGL